jgi:phage protein D
MGGSSIVVDGFDHYAKKAIRKELSPSDFKPSYGGSVDATMTGKRYDYVPMQSPQAVEAWARARLYRHRPTAFMFTAKLRGAVDLTIPAWLDLSGTKFRSRDNQVGVITKAVHTVTGGAYTMLLTCERDKFNP